MADDVRIGIVTALAKEYAATLAVVADLRRQPVPGDLNHYHTGLVPSAVPDRPHRVALTVLPRDGIKNATAVTADLLRSFPTIEYVIMCGVAGGIPCLAQPQAHVRLGDIVVATEVIDYDHVWLVDGDPQLRRHLPPPSSELVRADRQLEVKEQFGVRPWEDILAEAATRVEGFDRPPDRADILYLQGDPVAHPARERSGHRPGRPKVHHGPVASADKLVRDETLRDELARRYGTLAVEMEASGIVSSTDLRQRQWFMVRGIVDYCENTGKNDMWHRYASLAAASYVRALLAEHPPADGGALALPTAGLRPDNGLVDLLLAVPQVADPASRELIVQWLPPPIRHGIRRHSSAREDIIQILVTCHDHSDGLPALFRAIRAVAGDSISVNRAEEAYRTR